MPRDVVPLIAPATTAVVVHEVQDNLLVGDAIMYPGLQAHAEAVGLLEHLGDLLDAARQAGVAVYYVCSGDPSTGDRSHAGEIVQSVAPSEGDVTFNRLHGMTAFFTTPLDQYLRSSGVDTVVVTGVSANIGVVGSAIEAMNLGYQVVVPTDCMAGDPAEYAEQVIRYSLRNIALVTPSQPIIEYWRSASANP